MCFDREMRDILPKENLDNNGKDIAWYVEDLLLAYKYNMKSRYLKDLEYIRKYGDDSMIAMILERIADRSICMK